MSREIMNKALNEAGLTVDWCLEQIKQVGEDKKNGTLRMDVVDKIMNWHSLVDKEGFILPDSKHSDLSIEQQAEDAEFKEETTPKLID